MMVRNKLERVLWAIKPGDKKSSFLVSRFHNRLFVKDFSRSEHLETQQNGQVLSGATRLEEFSSEAASIPDQESQHVNVVSTRKDQAVNEASNSEKIESSQVDASDQPAEPSGVASSKAKRNPKQKRQRVDVLVITALKDEQDALLKCQDLPNSWERLQDGLDYVYWKTEFSDAKGRSFTVASATSEEMGKVAATKLATRLNDELKPKCLAMTGICAGREEKVFLGDVIVAERLLEIDCGKLRVHYSQQDTKKTARRQKGQEFIREEEMYRDIKTYNLSSLLKNWLENFPNDWINTITADRPRSFKHQEHWLLYRLTECENANDVQKRVIDDLDRRTNCQDWQQVLDNLRKEEFITKENPLAITPAGRKFVEEQKLRSPDTQYCDPPIPKSHIGAIGTTNQVQQDPELFTRLKSIVRSAIGIEMEGVAIGAVAQTFQIPMLVIKSVSDYGDHKKNDQFRHYAAETSARFLIAFLKEHFFNIKKS